MNQYHLWATTGALPITPSFSNYWQNTIGADRQLIGTGYNNQAYSLVDKTGSAALQNLNLLLRQYILNKPLVNTSVVQGSFHGQIESYGLGNGSLGPYYDGTAKNNFLIKIVDSSGSLRSNLYGGTANSTVLPRTSPETNRTFSGNLTAYSGVQSGDYLVIEFGLQFILGSGAKYNWTGSQRYGSYIQYGDLPSDNTTTNPSLNPWIEFSQNLS